MRGVMGVYGLCVLLAVGIGFAVFVGTDVCEVACGACVMVWDG
jgi:hypothetical protein